MRLISFCFVFLFSMFVYGQDNYKLIGIGADYSRTNSRFSTHDYRDITDMTGPAFSAADDSVSWYLRSGVWHKATELRLEGIFQKESGSRNLVKMGIQYDYGISKSASLADIEDHIIDTVIVSYIESGQTDTVYQDSISYQELFYSVHSRNAGVYAEYLVPLNKNLRHQVYTGFGVGIGYSISQRVSRSHLKSWVDDFQTDNGVTLYYGKHPAYNPSGGTSTILNPIEGVHTHTNSNKTFYISPYIPLSARTQISAKGFFSKLYLNITAAAGMRFGLTAGAGLDGRFFYSLRGGFSYMF